ncbi:MAG: hypothetical protein JNJ73_19865 [Hyphomonadaceae bacterium]|nr:hypothetical protein [Hyphomonadaceae bacterium]
MAELTDAEASQLDDASNVLALRAAGWKGEDLLQEAAERTLAGRRRWPAHVQIVAYLVKAMQSIIFAERKKALSRRANLKGKIDPDYSAVTDATQTQDDVEARLRAEITEAFKRHPNALKVALGTLEGLVGEELREFTGLDPTSYASARRQMRRDLERFVRNQS